MIRRERRGRGADCECGAAARRRRERSQLDAIRLAESSIRYGALAVSPMLQNGLYGVKYFTSRKLHFFIFVVSVDIVLS